MQTSGARNTDPSRKNAHQYRPLTQALRDRGCRRDASERGGKRVDAQFTGDPKQPHGDKSEYRPLTQGRERVGASPQVIPTANARIGGEGLENTDLPHRECRPFAQRIPTFRAKNTDLSRKGYRPFAQGITDRGRKGLPTPRARTAPNTDLSHK